VNSRFGESGMSELDGTMVCCFDLKKSRNDWRICVLVIMRKRTESVTDARASSELDFSGRGKGNLFYFVALPERKRLPPEMKNKFGIFS
jgi:hypothetical protein